MGDQNTIDCPTETRIWRQFQSTFRAMVLSSWKDNWGIPMKNPFRIVAAATALGALAFTAPVAADSAAEYKELRDKFAEWQLIAEKLKSIG